MQFLLLALPLAAVALANPLEARGACTSDTCLAAVTGSGALGDGSLRASHCESYLATTVTPPAITVTSTVTGVSSDWADWKVKRASVTVCPNEVPNYASACNTEAYSSACSCYGFTAETTTTIAPTTTTATVYVAPTSAGSCGTSTVTATVVSGTTCPAASTETATITGTVVSGTTCAPVAAVTSTVTKAAATVTVGGSNGTVTSTVTKAAVTVTVGGSNGTVTSTVTKAAVTVTVDGATATPSANSSVPTIVPDFCLTSSQAAAIVANFSLLLEFTSYNGSLGAPGSGYNQSVSDATLSPDFTDISDSINFMAGVPLGSVSFPSKQAFDIGQGVDQPEVTVQTLNIWNSCNSITWRWKITPFYNALPVNGINYMEIDENLLIVKNYAEFDSAAWLQSFGQKCALTPPTIASSTALKRRTQESRLLRSRGAHHF